MLTGPRHELLPPFFRRFRSKPINGKLLSIVRLVVSILFWLSSITCRDLLAADSAGATINVEFSENRTFALQNRQGISTGFSVCGWATEKERRHSGQVTIT